VRQLRKWRVVFLILTATVLSACERDRFVSQSLDIPENNPHAITPEFIERGRQRFENSCAMCHGSPGTGDGIATKSLKKLPPSYHTQKLRNVSDGYLFKVITEGPGSMPAFGHSLSEEERWALVAYIRELQSKNQ